MKKNMKKLIAVLLVINVVLGTSLSVNAASITESDGSATAEVTGTYVEAQDAPVFSVEITWKDFDFEYQEATREWNSTDHKYDEKSPAKWNKKGTITITNHSNVAISALPEYTPMTGFSNVSVSFNKSPLVLGSADSGIDGVAGKATTGMIYASPEGVLPKGTNGVKIGEVSITITEATEITSFSKYIMFGDAGVTVNLKEGMTWEEWINTAGSDNLSHGQRLFYVNGNEIRSSYDDLIKYSALIYSGTNIKVKPTDVIRSNIDYEFESFN